MDGLRKRRLPNGWYPSSSDEAVAQFQSWRSQYPLTADRYSSGVVPHAGWQFSGPLAFGVLQQMAIENGTILVVGGHLRREDPIVVAPEDGYETPFGPLEADAELGDLIRSELGAEEDKATDNTVEVHLPIVRYLFPTAKCLGVRCPPSQRSTDLGSFLAAVAQQRETDIAVVGSTDLTHYGPDYRFTPHGTGEAALRWVTEVNDRRMVSALEDRDHDAILTAGNQHRAACSAGAANTAAAFASANGTSGAQIVGYYTSHDIYPRESFVGYLGLGYRRR